VQGNNAYVANLLNQVCQELGYVDGIAICCSAYGMTDDVVMVNHTLRCHGNEERLQDCLVEEQCDSDMYASVVCFQANETVHEGM
jgi:hypothetical protein